MQNGTIFEKSQNKKSRAFALLFILRFFEKILDNRTKGGYNIDKR